MVLCAIIFGTNILRGYGYGESFMFAVALAVAAIPEALSSIVTIVLAIGTQKMAREHAIIKQLHAVESLGSVSIICSDKTGTLTQNKMVVEKLFFNSKIVPANQLNMTNKKERRLLEMCVLCNDALTQENSEIGDPTEIALLNLAEYYKIDEIERRKTIPRLSELPFDSERKLMSTLHKLDGELTLVTKGAVDVILTRTSAIETKKGIQGFGIIDAKQILEVNEQLAKEGLRVLALAYKKFDANRQINFEDENELIFTGLISMKDPPREESEQAVRDCINAGIKPVMITGDHKVTAIAIARTIGILKIESEAIEGYELDQLTDNELKKTVVNLSVYSRVSPAHKLRIVKAWQSLGHLVAMTGDGVNDAPALRSADIGIAMGKVGTEVAKEAADMVLTDDNFATIVKAVAQGRSIYTNIKHSIQFLLSGNTAGILAVLYTSITGLPLPFAAVQLLFINLITDSMPAIALGLEPPAKNIMNEKPRKVGESILTKSFMTDVLIEGSLIAAATLGAFYYGLRTSIALGSTLAFSTLTLARLLHGFNCRSKLPLTKIGLFTNKYQWLALIIGSTMLILVLTLDYLCRIFKADITGINYLPIIIGFAVIPLLVIQGYRHIQKN